MNESMTIRKYVIPTIILLLYYNTSSAFIIKNPLKKIIISKAITNSFMENISTEVFDNNVMLQQIYFGFDHNKYLVFYMICFLWYKLYGKQNTIKKKLGSDIIKDCDNKLITIRSYVTARRITKQALFAVLFIFGKNVDNVY